MHFIKLQAFLDQNKKNLGGATFSPLTMPFKDWVVGYVIRGGGEDFTIREIKSSDGKTHREDCELVLANVANETRTIKGSTASRYEFVSTGDVPPPPMAARGDVYPQLLNIAGIRELYPRKHGEGTRVLMTDKTAYIVADTFDQVEKLIVRAGGYIANGPTGETNNSKLAD